MVGYLGATDAAQMRLTHASRVLKTESDESVEADVSHPDQGELNEDTPAADAH
jgi:hypothetical protein